MVLYSFTFAPQCRGIGGGLKFHFSSIFFQPFSLLTQARQGLMSKPAFLLSRLDNVLVMFYCCSCGSFCRVSKIKLVPLMTSLIEFPMRLCELEKLSSRAIFNRIKNGVAAERQFCCQNKKIWLCYFIKHCKIMQFDFSVVKRLLFDV